MKNGEMMSLFDYVSKIIDRNLECYKAWVYSGLMEMPKVED